MKRPSFIVPIIASLTLAAVLALVGHTGHAQQAAGPAQDAGPLRFRFMGPAVGNRIASVAGVPGDPSTYYAGAASGGVWKSTDGGATFAPIFDTQQVMAIGALAVAPSDPRTVWAGTGESWAIRDVDVMGDGVYKSTDAGPTWTHADLDETGRIGRVIVHPADRLQSRLRTDSDGRPGLALALGRRRRRVESRELGPRARRPRRLLHPARRLDRRRKRADRHEQQHAPVDGRRRHVRAGQWLRR